MALCCCQQTPVRVTVGDFSQQVAKAANFLSLLWSVKLSVRREGVTTKRISLRPPPWAIAQLHSCTSWCEGVLVLLYFPVGPELSSVVNKWWWRKNTFSPFIFDCWFKLVPCPAAMHRARVQNVIWGARFLLVWTTPQRLCSRVMVAAILNVSTDLSWGCICWANMTLPAKNVSE